LKRIALSAALVAVASLGVAGYAVVTADDAQ
jgi:hypothetical protein